MSTSEAERHRGFLELLCQALRERIGDRYELEYKEYMNHICVMSQSTANRHVHVHVSMKSETVLECSEQDRRVSVCLADPSVDPVEVIVSYLRDRDE